MSKMNDGYNCLRHRDFVGAERHFLEAVADGVGAPAYAALSELREAQNKLNESEHNIRTAIDMEADQASFHVQYASLLLRMNRPSDALAQARIAMSLDGNDGHTVALLGKCLNKLDRCDDTVLEMRRGLLQFPGNIAIFISLIDALKGLGRLSEAYRLSIRARYIDPYNTYLQYLSIILQSEIKDTICEAQY